MRNAEFYIRVLVFTQIVRVRCRLPLTTCSPEHHSGRAEPLLRYHDRGSRTTSQHHLGLLSCHTPLATLTQLDCLAAFTANENNCCSPILDKIKSTKKTEKRTHRVQKFAVTRGLYWWTYRRRVRPDCGAVCRRQCCGNHRFPALAGVPNSPLSH